MKIYSKVLMSILGLLSTGLYASVIDGERSMVIVVPSYKNARWYKANLDSICNQNYGNYRVIYTDDCSPDGTGDLVEAYIKEKGLESKVTLVKNPIRRKALTNLYTMIISCQDDDIIVTVDGDDWLANSEVLKYLNQVYADGSIWMTYGQYAEYRGEGKPLIQGFNASIPGYVIENNRFRHQSDAFSHLRTFYAKLFKSIALQDLLYEGDFFPMTWDLAMMIPMMEMARHHFAFIPEILYIYNGANDLNDHKVDKSLQRNLDRFIRAKPAYQEIQQLF